MASNGAPVIVQAALSGSVADDSKNPAIPISDDEVIADALAVWRAGAAVIHLHAREADGTPSARAERFEAIADGIRAAGCDAVLNLSCGSCGGRVAGADRYDCVRLRPELASFDCGTVDFGHFVMEGPIEFLRGMAEAFAAAGTAAEIECFDSGHVATALRLRDEGLLPEPLRFLFVLGVGRGAPATLDTMVHLRQMIPRDAIWSACAPGRDQLRMTMLSLIAGGHARTGLEDNVWLARGVPATNEALVRRVVDLADQLERPVATVAQAREILAVGSGSVAGAG